MSTPHAANARATHDELAPCANQRSAFEALERADKVHKVKQDSTIRQNPRSLRALAFGTIVSTIAGCGGSSQVTSPSTLATVSAVVTIAPLTATVEPITSPGAGWLAVPSDLSRSQHERCHRSDVGQPALHALKWAQCRR